MVDISPKALRFACLAAQQQQAFARDSKIAVLLRIERERPKAGARTGFLSVSDDLADFCMDAVSSLLGDGTRLSEGDWDDNDVLFMRSFVQSIGEQLSAPLAGVR